VANASNYFPGTLDLLILKAVSEPVARVRRPLRIEQITNQVLSIDQGALYPALYRLEQKCLLSTEWGISENNRRAKYYSLTRAGRKQLAEEVDGWGRLVQAMAAAIQTKPEGV
jgi:transcriptional regulator